VSVLSCSLVTTDAHHAAAAGRHVLEAAVLELQLAAAEGGPRLVEVHHGSRMALRQIRPASRPTQMQ
jgi:hypothetical protein